MADETAARWERWLRAAAEINSTLLGGASADDVLRLIAEHVHRLSTSNVVLIALVDPHGGGQLIVRAAAGERAERLVGTIIDPEVPPGGYGPALWVPIGPANRVDGVLLALRDKGSAPFTADQVPVLAGFADQAALAERDRIAGSLHDHIIQRLFATGMALQGGVRRITDEEARRRVLRAVRQLDETVREIRTALLDRDQGSTAEVGEDRVE